jgi:hypothetical protein
MAGSADEDGEGEVVDMSSKMAESSSVKSYEVSEDWEEGIGDEGAVVAIVLVL